MSDTGPPPLPGQAAHPAGGLHVLSHQGVRLKIKKGVRIEVALAHGAPAPSISSFALYLIAAPLMPPGSGGALSAGWSGLLLQTLMA